MYSIDAGTTPVLEIRRGTMPMALRLSGKNASRSIRSVGSGTIFSVRRVMIPSVPSEPIRSGIRLYPVTFFCSFPPSSRTFPVGVTIRMPRT